MFDLYRAEDFISGVEAQIKYGFIKLNSMAETDNKEIIIKFPSKIHAQIFMKLLKIFMNNMYLTSKSKNIIYDFKNQIINAE